MEKNLIGDGYRLGILGGGQLGRMIIQSAVSYDIDIHIMDLGMDAPCTKIASTYTDGDIRDYDQVMEFGKGLDTLTVEIENVNIQALKDLRNQGVNVYPQPEILEIIRDKGVQKQFYKDKGIPTSEFELFGADTPTEKYIPHLPFVHKLRSGGYDGKGVSIIRSEVDFNELFDAPSVVEEMVPFTKELSVIVARNKSGETAVYQTVECEFGSANLVEYLFSPADISEEIEKKAQALAIDVINAFELVGILAVEMFLLENGDILVNEVAPRPHNSGHHTIECNITSQFEQHLRSVLNLPLGSTKMIRPGAMINVLGSEGFNGKAYYDGLENVMAQEGAYVHLYGKENTKPNRKMGHITVALDSSESAKQKAKEIKNSLRVISK